MVEQRIRLATAKAFRSLGRKLQLAGLRLEGAAQDVINSLETPRFKSQFAVNDPVTARLWSMAIERQGRAVARYHIVPSDKFGAKAVEAEPAPVYFDPFK